MNNQQRLHRILRRLVRPLRRRIQSPPISVGLDHFDGPTLILIAHPDDEVFCSGLVCELLSKGQEVALICFTRGEGGERGPYKPEDNLAQIRVEELTQAAKTLGLSDPTFLDYTDPICTDGQLGEPEHDSSELLRELETVITTRKISHLVTHGSSGEYWHPAHLCLHRHARVLNRRLPQLQLWTFNAWSASHPIPAVLNQDDATHLTLAGETHHQQRLDSLTCHRSQAEVFRRFGNGSLEDFISLTATECYRKW